MACVIRNLVICTAVVSCVSSVSSDIPCDYQVLAEWPKLEFSDSSNKEPKHNLISSVRRFGEILYISVPRWKVNCGHSFQKSFLIF